MKENKEKKNFSFATGLCSFLLIGTVSYFGFVEKYQTMWGMFASFAFIIFILNLDKFESFKIGQSGLEAKMNKVINEAYVKIEEMKKLGSNLLFFSLNSLISNVKEYNMPLEKCFTIFQATIEYSKELKLYKTQDIQNLEDEFLKAYAFRLHLAVYTSTSRLLNKLDLSKEDRNILIEKSSLFRNYPIENGFFDLNSIEIYLAKNNIEKDEYLSKDIFKYISFVKKYDLL